MKVIKVNACDVFDDDNEGYIYGLEQSIDDEGVCDYVEWFKTEKVREEIIRAERFEVVN